MGNNRHAVDVLAKLDAQPFVLDLEFGEFVLADEIEELPEFFEVHQISMRSVVTSVSTSTPSFVTSTSSSIRTPPQPAR